MNHAACSSHPYHVVFLSSRREEAVSRFGACVTCVREDKIDPPTVGFHEESPPPTPEHRRSIKRERQGIECHLESFQGQAPVELAAAYSGTGQTRHCCSSLIVADHQRYQRRHRQRDSGFAFARDRVGGRDHPAATEQEIPLVHGYV